MKKRIVSLLMISAMAASMMAGCGSSSSDTSSDAAAESTADTEAAAETTDSGEKQTLVLAIDVADEGFNTDILNAVQDKFGDKYDLVIKNWTGNDMSQTIKTAALADEQIDVCMWWPNQMVTFVDADLAVPLDDYMTDEWKAGFSEGALEVGTMDGVLYNLPYSTVYPMVIINQDVVDAAGVTLPEDGQWTWDEFLTFCTEIEDKTDAYGAVCPSGWTPWMTRNAYMQTWDNDEDLEAWTNGEVSFTDEKIVAASDMVVDAFQSEHFYPGGEASLALENDEAYAAFASGKAAALFCVNSIAVSALEETGVTNYAIMDWPAMGTNPTNPVLGGCNGYFIPTTCKNIDAAVEVLQFLTSEECATIRAEQGCVSTVTPAADAAVDTELMSQISRCSDQIHGEITNLSSEISDYMEKMPANYYYYGMDALNELEDLRLEAIGQ